MTIFYSTKTYDHSEGLSCVFRQWRATSRCRLQHGYAISVKFIFASQSLDNNNWVVDFGGLKDVKAWLKDTFDHTCCVASDDPELATFQALHDKGLIDIRVVKTTGCEGFADMILQHVDGMIVKMTNNRCHVHSVEVREHPGNSAIAKNDSIN